MSAGAIALPRCLRCGSQRNLRRNQLIGGHYCAKCDKYITAPAPKLEKEYNDRVAARNAKEQTS